MHSYSKIRWHCPVRLNLKQECMQSGSLKGMFLFVLLFQQPLKFFNFLQRYIWRYRWCLFGPHQCRSLSVMGARREEPGCAISSCAAEYIIRSQHGCGCQPLQLCGCCWPQLVLQVGGLKWLKAASQRLPDFQHKICLCRWFIWPPILLEWFWVVYKD